MAVKNTTFAVRPDIASSQDINNFSREKGVIVFDETNSVWKGYNGADWASLLSEGAINGFIDYNDTTGTVSIAPNTWTTIPNNGQGGFTNKTYAPEGITELMDVSTGAIDATELSLGDGILVRNDFQVNPNTNNALLQFRYQLGSGGNAYTLETNLGRLDDGSGKNYRFSLKPDLIYMGDENTRNNPIILQVRLSTSGTLINAGSAIQLIKK